MTKTGNFFDAQDDLTAAKIRIYKKYIETYLFKLLMGFGKCFIFDLFCGTGKNGAKKGSPLVLIDEIVYALSSNKLKEKKPTVYILFNDKESACINALRQNIAGIKLLPNIKLIVENLDFGKVLEKMKALINGTPIPKFIFLDPFKYSIIKIQDIKDLFGLGNAEILLFLPVFHCYRFASCKNFTDEHKTRKFLEEFTVNGISDYNGIVDFVDSIKRKIESSLIKVSVRPIILDDGTRKNALFLITKSNDGLLLMNKLAFKDSEDGTTIYVGREGQKSLFGSDGTITFKNFENNLKRELISRGEMSNVDIVDFTIKNFLLPRHAKKILIKFVKQGIIKTVDRNGNDTKNFYIAENPNGGVTIFRYIQNGNQQSTT